LFDLALVLLFSRKPVKMKNILDFGLHPTGGKLAKAGLQENIVRNIPNTSPRAGPR